MTEMEEFVALLKYVAKSYLISLLTGTSSATQQVQASQLAKPEEKPLEHEECAKPYIQ